MKSAQIHGGSSRVGCVQCRTVVRDQYDYRDNGSDDSVPAWVSYVDVISIVDTWGFASEQHTAAQDGDEKLRGKRVVTSHRGAPVSKALSSTDLLLMRVVYGILSAIALKIGRISTATMVPVGIDTVGIDGGM